ncbi:MAG TPA: TonB-dependent receptor, partial [Terriglobales bacterium]
FNAPISTVISPKDLRQSVYGVYINDNFKFRPNLTLNLGLRYEPASVPYVVGNQISNLRVLTAPTPVIGAPYFQNSTYKNFAPRVGAAWNVFGDGATVIRAAYGIYDALPLNYLFEGISIFAAPFFQQGSVSSLQPGSFPKGGYPLLAGNNLRYSLVQYNPSRSYVQQWNVNIQHEFAGQTVFQIGYFGTHGVHLPYRIDDANTVWPTTVVDNNYFFPVPRGSGTRINPAVGQISALYFTGGSTYNALQVMLTKHLVKNFQGNISYTWGKSLDDGSSSTFGDTFANSISSLPLWAPPRRRGLSDFNIAQSFVGNLIYNLPTYHSAKAWIISGWQIGSIVLVSTGLPFSPLISGDPLGLNSADPFAFPNRLTTPACQGNPVNTQNRSHYIKTECFTFPTPGTMLGSAGRNSIIGPGIRDVDLSLMKNNQITERLNAQFRVDFFNIFNFVNYATPLKASTQLFNQAGAPIASAGTLTQTSTSSRQIQFAIKLIF